MNSILSLRWPQTFARLDTARLQAEGLFTGGPRVSRRLKGIALNCTEFLRKKSWTTGSTTCRMSKQYIKLGRRISEIWSGNQKRGSVVRCVRRWKMTPGGYRTKLCLANWWGMHLRSITSNQTRSFELPPTAFIVTAKVLETFENTTNRFFKS